MPSTRCCWSRARAGFVAAALLVLAPAGCSSAANTAAPPGPLDRFDPIATFAAMAAYAGPHARVVQLQATHVRVDGTIDLTAASRPKLDAEFVAAAIAGDPETRPPGEFAVGHSIVVRLTVEAPHTSPQGQHRGMERTPTRRTTGDERTLEPPECTFAALWQAAIGQGAPTDTTATIAYTADGYTFTADGGAFERRFKADCSPVAAKRARKK